MSEIKNATEISLTEKALNRNKKDYVRKPGA